jgi:hypothetical protein
MELKVADQISAMSAAVWFQGERLPTPLMGAKTVGH